MKIKNIIIKLILSFFIIFKSYSNEILLQSSNMDIKNNGNLITAFDGKIEIPKDKLTISAKRIKYDKIENLITFKDNVKYEDLLNNVLIEGEIIIYNRNKDLIYSEGVTNIKFEKKYDIRSSDIFYNKKLKELYSKSNTYIEDYEKNNYELKKNFYFDISNEILKSSESTITDKNNNKYIFEDLQIDLKNQEIAGKEIKVEFNNSYFGNKKMIRS